MKGRGLNRVHGVPSDAKGKGQFALAVGRAQLELEGSLKASAKVFIEEAVNDGIDAAVKKGQPVSKWIHINVNDPVLVLRQAGVVTQHHQSPQRKPG